MSADDIDALADAARNRGLKLIRSRVRTPTRRRFGKLGLADAKGQPVFGLDAKGPTAKPDEVADYLRALGNTDWSESLGSAGKRKARKAAAKPKAAPKPPPEPKVREAKPGDSDALVTLIMEAGFDTDAAGIRQRVATLRKQGFAPLVAVLGTEVVGLCGISAMTALHRPKPVGRLHILVVAKPHRGAGLGRMLVDAAEDRLRRAGCEMLEVTSNDKLTKAHAFYRRLGFEQTSKRFRKLL